MRYVESINHALHGLLAEQENVYLIGEDLLDPYGGAFKAAKGLSTSYPDRVLTTPISEAGLTGVAIGMAMRGYRPIVEIMFGDFLMLCTDQIVNHATKFSYMYNEQVQVPLTIRTPMGGYRGYGPTHSQTLEAMFLGVPRLTILAPSHYHDPGDVLARGIMLPNVEPGDWIVFRDTGAYTLSMWSRHCNRGIPRVLGYDEGSGFATLRREEEPDDLVRFWGG